MSVYRTIGPTLVFLVYLNFTACQDFFKTQGEKNPKHLSAILGLLHMLDVQADKSTILTVLTKWPLGWGYL